MSGVCRLSLRRRLILRMLLFRLIRGRNMAKRAMLRSAICAGGYMFCASRKRLMVFASPAFAKQMIKGQATMPKSKRLLDTEVRELPAADMKRFQNTQQALFGTLLKKLNVRGPQKTPTKERITIRLSPKWFSAYAIRVKADKRVSITRLRVGSSRIQPRAYDTKDSGRILRINCDRSALLLQLPAVIRAAGRWNIVVRVRGPTQIRG